MRKTLYSTLLFCFISASAYAQLQLDKQLQMTGGTDSDRRITNIGAPAGASDAVNAGSLQSGSLSYAAATGSSGNYVVTLTPAPTAYTGGMVVNFKANHANTGAATLKVNSLAAIAIKSGVIDDLTAGDIENNQMVSVIFDGTNFQLISRSSTPGSLPPSGAAGGSLTGSYPNPGIATGAVSSNEIANATITASDLATTGVGAGTYNNVTVNAQGQVTAGSNTAYLTTETDGSITNEGSLTVLPGAGNTSIIRSNTSGSTDVTIQAGTNVNLVEAGNTITINSTNPGGTVTSVGTGAGLTGGPITDAGTISVASGGITNAMLANPSLTVSAGTGLSGGGSVALGGSVTLNLATPVSVANGGTGTTSTFTPGSVVFAGASGVYAQNNGNFYWDNSNARLGIATNSPAMRLSFNNLNDGTNGADGITWYNPSPTTYGIYRTAGAWTAPNYQQLRLAWDVGVVIDPGVSYGKSYLEVQGNGMRVTGSGTVGIGLTAPAAKLHVSGGGAIIGTNGTSSNTRTLTILSDGQAQTNWGSYPGAWTSALQIQNNDNTRFIWMSPLDNASGGNARLLTYNTGLDLYVGSNAHAMTVNNAGQVGIGTTAPGEMFSVYKATGGWQGRFSNGGNSDVYLAHGDGYGMHIRGHNTNDGVYTLEMYNASTRTSAFYNSGRTVLGLAGNVGINTYSPAEKLDVEGNILYQGVRNQNGTVSTYKISTKRYHVIANHNVYGGYTLQLDMATVAELCGDEDGCRLSLWMRRWSAGNESEGAAESPVYVLFYNASDGRWRLGGNSGVVGGGGRQHVLQSFGCFLTDGYYTAYNDWGDYGYGFGLLSWNNNGYTNANKTCELTLDD